MKQWVLWVVLAGIGVSIAPAMASGRCAQTCRPTIRTCVTAVRAAFSCDEQHGAEARACRHERRTLVVACRRLTRACRAGSDVCGAR